MSNKFRIYCDGSCINNNLKDKSLVSSGTGIYSSDLAVEYSEKSDDITNNQAEYSAIIRALEIVFSFAKEGIIKSYDEVVVYSDSELIVHQINSKLSKNYKPFYRINDPVLANKCNDVLRIVNNIRSFRIQIHIRRSSNKYVHELAINAAKR
jgi:ribonuclease HI